MLGFLLLRGNSHEGYLGKKPFEGVAQCLALALADIPACCELLGRQSKTISREKHHFPYIALAS
jgi:hypothetical protein